jgi:hypothetical protein
MMEGQGLPTPCFGYRQAQIGLSGAGLPRQHLLDFDSDPVAVDQHHAAGDRQVIGEDFDFVCLGGVQFDDGAATQPHDLMNRHRSGTEDHHEIDGDFIEGWHWGSDPYLQLQNCVCPDQHVMVSQWLIPAKTSI